MSTTRKRVAGAMAIAALAVPAPALAQTTDPVGPTYGRIGGVTESDVAGGGGTAGARAAAPDQGEAGQRGSLPFTGFDVGLAAGAGLLLVLLGFGMRFLARQRTA